VLLTPVALPEYSANAIGILRSAGAEAGRDWDDFEVAQIINTSVEDDHARAGRAERADDRLPDSLNAARYHCNPPCQGSVRVHPDPPALALPLTA